MPSNIPGKNPATKLLPEKSSEESLVVDPSLIVTPSIALEVSAVDVGSSEVVAESVALVWLVVAGLEDDIAEDDIEEVVEVALSVEAVALAI